MRQKKGLPPKEAPLLPSDRDQTHVYGKPSSLQSEEQVRISGCAPSKAAWSAHHMCGAKTAVHEHVPNEPCPHVYAAAGRDTPRCLQSCKGPFQM